MNIYITQPGNVAISSINVIITVIKKFENIDI